MRVIESHRAVPIHWRPPLAAPFRKGETWTDAMPATRADIEELQGILRHIRQKTHRSPQEHTYQHALEKAIRLLEDERAPTLTKWVLGALHQCGHWNKDRTLWIVDDRELFNDAMRVIGELHGDAP